MRQVLSLLGHAVGHDVRLYTLTLDPEDDLGRWSTVSLGMRPERIVQALDRVMLPADQRRNEAEQI
jgi:cytochrome oxidase Cu insertion factor (SCO1/SenC/PrrC family)